MSFVVTCFSVEITSMIFGGDAADGARVCSLCYSGSDPIYKLCVNSVFGCDLCVDDMCASHGMRLYKS